VECNFVSKETTLCDDISEIFRLATASVASAEAYI